jgi:hypothetical protein
MKKVAILQSNYIPWKGYFDIINFVDEFIIYDDVQYTKNDWRNRNQIKTSKGVEWLTVPVNASGRMARPVKDIKVAGHAWRKKHLKSWTLNYGRAACFKEYSEWLGQLYNDDGLEYLSEINYKFITEICRELEIDTKISWSSDYELSDGKNERLISLCQQAGATEYLSGPAAKDYIDESMFAAAGIKVSWMEYSGYPEYPQLFPPFEHGVSILDLILNTGRDASKYMKSLKK